MINLHIGLGGHFTIHKGKLDSNNEPESREYVTDFDNLVLDKGLERIGTNIDWMDWLHLGSGITAPAPLQNTLVNATYRGTSNTDTQYGINIDDELNPYCWIIRIFRVTPRGESRTYSELGVGWSADSLFSRTLIKDPSGGQNTITILGDEYLDVTYEARMYIPVDTAVYTVTPTGDDIEPREITVHASNMSNVSESFGWSLGHTRSGRRPNSICGDYTSVGVHYDFYDGGRGNLFQRPEGTRVGTTFNAVSTVRSSDTSMVFNFSRGIGSNVGLLRTLHMSQHSYCFQMEFNPPISKTDGDVFTFSYSISWGRR